MKVKVEELNGNVIELGYESLRAGIHAGLLKLEEIDEGQYKVFVSEASEDVLKMKRGMSMGEIVANFPSFVELELNISKKGVVLQLKDKMLDEGFNRVIGKFKPEEINTAIQIQNNLSHLLKVELKLHSERQKV